MDTPLADRLTHWRHHLHAHPELSLQEAATAAFVQDRLRELGVPFTAGVGGHGVVATLSRGASNRSVGLRADMDALPIRETTGLPYASRTQGVMHACGHDGHTTALLGAVALLAADPGWSGTVHCVFQPAEEGHGGARAMLADGLLDRFPMERIFALHNWPGLAVGAIAVHDGAVMAGGSGVSITLHGQAGHAAMPHLARDPMLAAAHLLVALQSIVARDVDPLDTAVLSICTMQGGVARNQIPSSATMSGTFRTYRAEVRDMMDGAIHRIAHGVAQTFDMRAEVTTQHGAAAVVNTEAALAAAAAEDAGLPLRRDLPPSMASEDFGHYLQRLPGAFAWVGNGEASPALHTPEYNFADAALPAAAGWLAAVARRALL
jgi:hippurate hydrolase